MNRKIMLGIMVFLMMSLLFAGCAGDSKHGGSGGESGDDSQNVISTEEEDKGKSEPRELVWKELEGTFNSLLWGSYTYDEWIVTEGVGNSGKEFVKYSLDYEKFYDSVKFTKCSAMVDGKAVSVELSAVPIRIIGAFPLGSSNSILESFQKENEGQFQTIWGSDFWEKPINNIWGLQDWGDKIHDAYLKKFGKNDHWGNFKSLMNLNVMQMEYVTKDKKLVIVSFLYQVEGNLLHLYEWEADKKTFEVSTKEWGTLEFSFDGRNLMLRREGCMVSYCPSAFSQKANKAEHVIPSTDGYANDIGMTCRDLLGFFLYSGDESKGTVDFTDGGRAVDSAVGIDEDKITIRWDKRYRRVSGEMKLEEKADELSFEYIWTEPFGVVLRKDGKFYRYQHSANHYYENQLGEYLDESVMLGELSKEQIDQLIAEQTKILNELQEAFKQAEIDIEIDSNSGKVTMDSSILFGVDEASLSAEGKDYLDRFLTVYSSVVMSDKYADTVSEILVEGHTDTDGSYDHNMELSERRANFVKQYCLEVCPELQDRISAKGCSYDSPVYDADGNIDKAASRRVVFKFKLRMKEAAEQDDTKTEKDDAKPEKDDTKPKKDDTKPEKDDTKTEKDDAGRK